MFGIAKLEEGIRTFLLFLLAMQVEYREVNVIQEFRVIFHAAATGEKHDNLLLEVSLEEGKQEQEAFVRVAKDVALFKGVHGTVFLRLIDVDI